MQKLIKASSIKDDELFKLFAEIEKCCEICSKYKQPGLKPIVGFSLPKKFNDTVPVDLKENANRFRTADAVPSKRKGEIADSSIKHWIVVFGAPGVILSDNGGEFNNSLFLNMGEQFNITLKITAESSWSNSMVERHNGILAKTIEKLILDSKNKYSIDVVIAWAVNAKSSLHNCHGLSLTHVYHCFWLMIYQQWTKVQVIY